ncbi:Rossmann-fold NAD(P)-binding domain-containing protein [Salinibius halmophilus]|uniref:hypothetical protein n=1 Tax=Salinibius halmophilus TaxID=1853216 RepID=UPI000E65F3F2|nr:hypothetical protein [Salinibius halmophilus]
MHSTDYLFIGFGALNQNVAALLKQTGRTTLGIRRRQQTGALVLDASLPWTETVHCKVAVVAVSADERTPDGYRASYQAVAEQVSSALLQGKLVANALIWVSSTRVLGAATGNIDDETAAQPNDEAGEVLAHCEQIVADMPITTTVARLTGIYGTGRQWMLRQWREGKLHGDGTLTNRIEATDAARALALIAQRLADGMPVPETLLVTDLESVSRDAIARWLDQQIGQTPSDSMPVPATGRIMTPKYLQATGFQWRYPSFRYGYLPWLHKLD